MEPDAKTAVWFGVAVVATSPLALLLVGMAGDANVTVILKILFHMLLLTPALAALIALGPMDQVRGAATSAVAAKMTGVWPLMLAALFVAMLTTLQS